MRLINVRGPYKTRETLVNNLMKITRGATQLNNLLFRAYRLRAYLLRLYSNRYDQFFKIKNSKS